VLVERVFEIGGILLASTGAILLVEVLRSGLDLVLIGYLETGGILCGFGIFFSFVGRDARRARLALLRTGEEGANPTSPVGPRR